MSKRLFDIMCALLGLLFLSPVMICIGILVALRLGRPVLFSQVRPGLNSKAFKMFKFRTMLNLVDDQGLDLSDTKRMTKLGGFLRASSLDELPEFWNVLKGEMSLVGPRPLLMEYLPLYSEKQLRRHEVKPGITGWAQVNGRNALTWEEKFELDVWYVENQSFWLDLKILLMTIKKVFVRDDITHKGDVTMPKFTGSGDA